MKNSDRLIEAASFADISALDALVNSAYRGESSRAGWTTEADFLEGQRTDPESLREFLEDSENHRILILRERSVLLACVCIEKISDSRGVACYLGMLTVSPTAQNRGLGKTLLEAAEREARAWGAERMTISVIQLRESLINWYKRCGYSETGERKSFPYGQAKFGIPKREDLYFEVFEKPLPL